VKERFDTMPAAAFDAIRNRYCCGTELYGSTMNDGFPHSAIAVVSSRNEGLPVRFDLKRACTASHPKGAPNFGLVQPIDANGVVRRRAALPITIKSFLVG
jgi:hypothetical protein